MQHEPKTKRLPRYKRAPEGFGRFEPTARDLEILRLVDDYRFLTSDHVFALVPGSKRQIARRLQGMYHHSFLSRLLPPLRMRDGIDDSPSGSPKFTYALDSEGAAAICHADKIPREELRWRAEHNGRMQWFIEHSLMVSTFRATMQLALAMRKDLNFVEWADEEELRDSVRVRYPNGRTELHRVAPDGYFAVRERGLHRNFFLEADRATEEHPRILAKFQSYWWYLSPGSAAYHEKFENPANRLVLVVCTSEKRMAAMRKTLARVGDSRHGLSQFWFTTDSSYRLAHPDTLLAPIWRAGPRTQASETERKPDPPRALFEAAQKGAP